MDEPHEPPLPEPDARALRFLRRLVTALTATMMLGMVVLVVLFLTRFPGTTGSPLLPEGLALPQGAVPLAVTRGPDFWAVVTEAREILIFDAAGALRQRVPALPTEPPG